MGTLTSAQVWEVYYWLQDKVSTVNSSLIWIHLKVSWKKTWHSSCYILHHCAKHPHGNRHAMVLFSSLLFSSLLFSSLLFSSLLFSSLLFSSLLFSSLQFGVGMYGGIKKSLEPVNQNALKPVARGNCSWLQSWQSRMQKCLLFKNG